MNNYIKKKNENIFIPIIKQNGEISVAADLTLVFSFDGGFTDRCTDKKSVLLFKLWPFREPLPIHREFFQNTSRIRYSISFYKFCSHKSISACVSDYIISWMKYCWIHNCCIGYCQRITASRTDDGSRSIFAVYFISSTKKTKTKALGIFIRNETLANYFIRIRNEIWPFLYSIRTQVQEHDR